MIDVTIDRAMEIYAMMPQRAGASDKLRAKLTDYITKLHEAGESDHRRLMVFGLMYLREYDGRSDPVKAGFTGL